MSERRQLRLLAGRRVLLVVRVLSCKWVEQRLVSEAVDFSMVRLEDPAVEIIEIHGLGVRPSDELPLV